MVSTVRPSNGSPAAKRCFDHGHASIPKPAKHPVLRLISKQNEWSDACILSDVHIHAMYVCVHAIHLACIYAMYVQNMRSMLGSFGESQGDCDIL